MVKRVSGLRSRVQPQLRGPARSRRFALDSAGRGRELKTSEQTRKEKEKDGDVLPEEDPMVAAGHVEEVGVLFIFILFILPTSKTVFVYTALMRSGLQYNHDRYWSEVVAATTY